LTSQDPLPPNRVSVVCLTCKPGEQALRVNGKLVAGAAANLAPSEFTQMLIGWGFLDYYPRDSFGGQVYAVVTGRGAPTVAELLLLERFLVANSSST
jgi:endoglucanase